MRTQTLDRAAAPNSRPETTLAASFLASLVAVLFNRERFPKTRVSWTAGNRW